MYFWCICGEEGDLHILLLCHLEGPLLNLVLTYIFLIFFRNVCFHMLLTFGLPLLWGPCLSLLSDFLLHNLSFAYWLIWVLYIIWKWRYFCLYILFSSVISLSFHSLDCVFWWPVGFNSNLIHLLIYFLCAQYFNANLILNVKHAHPQLCPLNTRLLVTCM